MPERPPVALSPKRLCHELGISRSLLYEAWSEGSGPPSSKVGRRRVVILEDAITWLRSREEKTGG